MKAILIAASGDPNVLQLTDVKEPTIQSSTKILVQLKAAGINPIAPKKKGLQSKPFFNEMLLTVPFAFR